MNPEFAYKPATWLPKHDVEMLERVRNIKREDMEYTNENGFSVKVVQNPTLLFVADVFQVGMDVVFIYVFFEVCHALKQSVTGFIWDI